MYYILLCKYYTVLIYVAKLKWIRVYYNSWNNKGNNLLKLLEKKAQIRILWGQSYKKEIETRQNGVRDHWIVSIDSVKLQQHQQQQQQQR